MIGRLLLRLSPAARREAAIWSVDLSILGMAASPFLGRQLLLVVAELSWAALVLTSLDWLTTSDVRKSQDDA